MSRASGPTPKRDARTGTWYFVFESEHPGPDGQRRQRRRRGFRTKVEAQRALDAARAEDAALFAPVDGLTVAAVLDRFITIKGIAGKAPRTIAQYEWAAGFAKLRWGAWAAERLTADHLDAAYADMLAGRSGRALSARSVEMIHKTVKAAFQAAVDRGQLVRNPARLATPPQVREQRYTCWTPEQVGAFLAFVRTKETRAVHPRRATRPWVR